MKNARIFKFTGNGAVTLGEYRLSDTSVKDYTLRVEAVGNRLTYFLNGKKIISCTDSQFSSGKMGLLICNSTSVFQDTVFTQVDSGTPRLTGLRLEETAYAPAFDSNTFSYTAQVGYETTSIKLTPEEMCIRDSLCGRALGVHRNISLNFNSGQEVDHTAHQHSDQSDM